MRINALVDERFWEALPILFDSKVSISDETLGEICTYANEWSGNGELSLFPHRWKSRGSFSGVIFAPFLMPLKLVEKQKAQ